MHREFGADPAEAVVGHDAVLCVLARLSATDRDILRLVAWEGLDHAGAGVVLGCSTTAARVRLHRARRHFARALDGVESGDEAGEISVSLPGEMP